MSKTLPDDPGDLQLQEQLVAYLDNELDEQTSLEIERLMATDVTVRNQIRKMQKAWDLLDQLPRAEANERFTTSTVEMIVADVAADLERQQSDVPRRRNGYRLLGCGALALAAMAGVLVADRLWPSPDQQLLENLPVVRQLDAYRHASSVPFLQSLEEQGLFLEAEVGDES